MRMHVEWELQGLEWQEFERMGIGANAHSLKLLPLSVLGYAKSYCSKAWFAVAHS